MSAASVTRSARMTKTAMGHRSASTLPRGLTWCAAAGAAWLAAACAVLAPAPLQQGVSNREEVLAALGEPALRWQDPDGREQLAYPHGPAGTETFMAFLAPDGRLEKLEKVLNIAHFARIEPGRSDRAAVLRLLGPALASGTSYFARRNELVWEWRYCDEWNGQAFFDVMFDAATGIVRSTMQRPELGGWDGVQPQCSQWVLPVR